jgi:hypothetical protein
MTVLARASNNLSDQTRPDQQFRALSCIVRHHYHAMTSEDIADWEDLVLVVVICSVCRLV